jgi:hypothetical protein
MKKKLILSNRYPFPLKKVHFIVIHNLSNIDLLNLPLINFWHNKEVQIKKNVQLLILLIIIKKLLFANLIIQNITENKLNLSLIKHA